MGGYEAHYTHVLIEDSGARQKKAADTGVLLAMNSGRSGP
jgi:hypothetical protein